MIDKAVKVEDYIKNRKEILKQPLPLNFWFNGFDILNHVLKSDPSKTLFNNLRKDRVERYKEMAIELAEHIEKYKIKDAEYQEIEEEAVVYKPKKVTRYDTRGDFDAEAYLDEMDETEPRCFITEETEYKDQPALDIIMDSAVYWSQRNETFMEKRHGDIYKIALKAQEEERPCRVIAWDVGKDYPELNGKKIEKKGWMPKPVHQVATFTIIKDYEDSIFPGIWGAFSKNWSTNTFNILISAFFLGTSHSNMGLVPEFNLTDEFEGNTIDTRFCGRFAVSKRR